MILEQAKRGQQKISFDFWDMWLKHGRSFCSPQEGHWNFSKCFYYIIAWKWIDGLPQMLTIDEMPVDKICLTTGLAPDRVPIK